MKVLLTEPPQPSEERWHFTDELQSPLWEDHHWTPRELQADDVSLIAGVDIIDGFRDPDHLLETAYNDLRRFFFIGNVSLTGNYTIKTEYQETDIPESFQLDISLTHCIIKAGDTEGIRRSIFGIEDMWLRISDFSGQENSLSMRKNNAVAVWLYAPGFIDADDNDVFRLSTMRYLTGFDFKNSPGGQVIRWEDKNHPISHLSDKIQSHTTGVTFGVTNADKVLASTDIGGALAVKEMENWRSVYSGIPLTSEMLQGLCDYAGVHVYSRSYDVLYANKSYVMLYTATAGDKTISLPEKSDVREMFSNQDVAHNVKQFNEQVPSGTARLYLLAE